MLNDSEDTRAALRWALVNLRVSSSIRDQKAADEIEAMLPAAGIEDLWGEKPRRLRVVQGIEPERLTMVAHEAGVDLVYTCGRPLVLCSKCGLYPAGHDPVVACYGVDREFLGAGS